MPRLRSPLVTPEDLAAALDIERLVVADVRWYLTDHDRGRREYDAGHIPGAVFVDLDRDLAAPTGPGRHPLPRPADFAARMGALGIGDETFVVAYDEATGGNAARLWWMLDDLGHRDAAILDGGFAAWTAIDGPTTAETARPDPRELHLAHRWRRVVDRSGVVDLLGRALLLDGRAPERYRGDVEPVDPVPGHIPSAVNHPIARNLRPDGRFLAPSELAVSLAALGVGDGRPVVTSCGSGVNACQTALAMRLAGSPDPLLYEGSYSDWSRAGMPIATGDAPGIAEAVDRP